MTDENAEKIEPCAWCGKTPLLWEHKAAYACQCPMCANANVCLVLEDWNRTQGRILARRRADFEAGQRSVISSNGEGVRWEHERGTFEEWLLESKGMD